MASFGGRVVRRLAIACDHAGHELKAALIARLTNNPDWHPIDLGLPAGDEQDDYPDAARLVAEALLAGRADRGLLICGSGIGVAIAAGKFREIGAALVADPQAAREGVRSEGLNVLCLGARSIETPRAFVVLDAFLEAEPMRLTRRRHGRALDL